MRHGVLLSRLLHHVPGVAGYDQHAVCLFCELS
jgi:hypothetical protein